MRRLVFSLCLLLFSTSVVVAQEQYDLVLEGGRVIDPETGLDGVRNVGIREGKIGRVATEALSGRRVGQGA
jgi:N-acyl-D-aspartate/D-glutamate deacylase